MRLGICSNFSYPSVGGSEVVVHQIAKRLVKEYGYEVVVFAFNVDKEIVHEGVKYTKCEKNFYFFNQIKHNNLDHLFIYSDSFWEFKNIISEQGIAALKDLRLSIGLLGMNAMREDKKLYEQFKKHHRKFRVITHSTFYDDYKKCREDNIPVTVIPNGVDVEEFSGKLDVLRSFKEKYGINSKHIILNVANFFFGKGQVYLPKICNKLACPKFGIPRGGKYPKNMGGHGRNDFCLVSISNTVKYPHEKMFLDRFERGLEAQEHKFEYKVLRDIPREDVVDAFMASYAFLFTSLKEVFPLVILEAMAAHTPWVSMNVGCLEEYAGGLSGLCSPGYVIRNDKLDAKGNKVITTEIIDEYANCVNMLLSEFEIRADMAGAGNDLVESKYTWEKIVELYHNVFI
tara:strand:+ start:25023 stop:26222 length:1200 start_codon:yes stop_codon:yes gene_type:complete